MATPANRLLSQLRRRYVTGLTVIALLILLGQFLIQVFLTQHATDANRTAHVTSQIALSREIAKDVTSLQFATSETRVERLETEIAAAVERLAAHHKTLVAKSPLRAFLIEIEIDTPLAEISDLASRLKDVSASERSPSFDRLLLAQELSKKFEIYLSRLDATLVAYQNLNRDKIRTLQVTELILVVLAIVVLILEGVFVFHPAIQNVEKSFAEAEAARREAQQASRIKSDFLGKMSHEIKNPLNAILGMSELLSEAKLPPDQKRFSNILSRSASGLKTLLENLLDFSSIEANKFSLEMVPFSLYSVVEKAADIASPLAYQKGLELIIDAPPELCFRTEGDPVRLGQVLVNLLNNAAKFTTEGEITLSLRGAGTPAVPAIRFCVSDTGCGIAETEAKGIFEEFSQANPAVMREFGGTGLGLSICKQIVEAWGGKIHFRSRQGKGSEFYFELPLRKIGESAAQKRIERIEIPKRALLISPNRALRESLASALEPYSSVSVAESEADALRQIEASDAPREIGTVVLDNRLVDAATLGFVEKLRELLGESVQIIMMLSTAHASEEIVMANSFGIRRFLFKPIIPIQLLRELDVTVEREFIAGEDRSARGDARDERPLRILAVDDSKDNRIVLEAYFAASNYIVDYAKNGQLALQAFRTQRYDIILMDIEMPIMGGVEAAGRIRKHAAENGITAPPIVALTAYDWDAKTAGEFSGYLRKPLDRAVLFKEIRKHTAHIKSATKSAEPSAEYALPEEKLARLMPKYLSERRRDLTRIQRELDQGRFDTVARIGHNLKGSAANYGLSQLGVIGARLHEAARAEDADEIREATLELEKSLEIFEARLEQPK